MPNKTSPSILDRFRGQSGRLRLLDAIRSQSLVAGDLVVARKFLSCGQVSVLQPQQQLIAQGASDDDIFLILSGGVSIMVNGREIASREAGDHVGEMTVIDTTAVRSATVIARDLTVVAKIRENDFQRIADAHPALWRRIAVAIAKRLRERSKFQTPPRSEPAIFIGSSAEGLRVANVIYKSLLRRNVIPRLWSEGVFECSKTTIEDLMHMTRESDFAIIVMTADDVIHSRGKKTQAPRDNILFELGLFMGALARERTFIVARRGVELKIPTDLLGITLLRYRRQHGKTLAQSLQPVTRELYRLITKYGPL